MLPKEIEENVYEKEEVRIVIRADIITQLGDYTYARKAAGTTSITEWLDQRIKPLLRGHDVVVIDGFGRVANGRMRMSTLRDSYTV